MTQGDLSVITVSGVILIGTLVACFWVAAYWIRASHRRPIQSPEHIRTACKARGMRSDGVMLTCVLSSGHPDPHLARVGSAIGWAAIWEWDTELAIMRADFRGDRNLAPGASDVA